MNSLILLFEWVAEGIDVLPSSMYATLDYAEGVFA